MWPVHPTHLCWTFPGAGATGARDGLSFPLAEQAVVSSSAQARWHGAAPASPTWSPYPQLSWDSFTSTLFPLSYLALIICNRVQKERRKEGIQMGNRCKEVGEKELGTQKTAQNCPSWGCMSTDRITVHDSCLSLTQPSTLSVTMDESHLYSFQSST